jgi:hypothetical protein
MTQQEGKQFITDVLTHVWRNYDASKINDYYHEDIQGEVNGNVIDINDIRNQAEFCQEKYLNTSSEVLSTATNDNKIMAHVKQTNTLKQGDETAFQFMVEYQLRANKVAKIFVISHPGFDYKLKC